MKRVLTLIILAVCATGVFAQRITEQEALDRALQYMSTSMNTGMRAPSRGGGAKPEHSACTGIQHHRQHRLGEYARQHAFMAQAV